MSEEKKSLVLLSQKNWISKDCEKEERILSEILQKARSL